MSNSICITQTEKPQSYRSLLRSGRETQAAYLAPGAEGEVLLIDDRLAFRRAIAAALRQQQVDPIEAAGVYDALRQSAHRTISTIVIGGELPLQGAWRCAAKLCGTPPWEGVVMYFDTLDKKQRKWADVSGLGRLVETGRRPEPVVEAVSQLLHQASSRAAG